MKFTTILSVLFLLSITVQAQQTITSSISHDGLDRAYILYLPAGYEEGGADLPLVLNFHGYTSNANEQMFYGDFRSIADTANFIVVHPAGTVDDNGNTHWNVGWGASTVDDIGFTAALLDSLSANYNVDQERIYSTGMSNGGFMSYELACEMSDRIAAIASVTGTMNAGRFSTCNPGRPVPVLEIHGTADPTVPYNGANWIEGSEDVVAFWADFNNCDETPIVTDVPDINITDDSTVEWWRYRNGDSGAEVELFKIFDGGHTWPGTAFAFPATNYDINASVEIWRFFSRYDINGAINVTSSETLIEEGAVGLFPNPVQDQLYLTGELAGITSYHLSTLDGKVVLKGTLIQDNPRIDLSHLPEGLYLLQVGDQLLKVVKQ